MKKRLRANLALKVLAVILVVITAVCGFWSSVITLLHWDDLWSDRDYYSSSSCYSDQARFAAEAENAVRELWLQNAQSGQTTESIDVVSAVPRLDRSNTNFRFRLLDAGTGEVLDSNLPAGQVLEQTVREVSSQSFLQVALPDTSSDYIEWDEEECVEILHIVTEDGEHRFSPLAANAAAEYGWYWDGYSWCHYDAEDCRFQEAGFLLEYGVADPLTVQDDFWRGKQQFDRLQPALPYIALSALALDVVTVLLLVFLCLGAGRRKGQEQPVCSTFDKLPLDILVVLEIIALALLFNAGDGLLWLLFNHYSQSLETPLILLTISAGIAVCLLAFLLTVATRIKTRTIFSNTIIWRLCKVIFRAIRRACRAWPLMWKAIAIFLIYLAGSILTALPILAGGYSLFLLGIVLVILWQALALTLICFWTVQWKRVRLGTAQIVGGDPDYKIDNEKMFWDLKEHADQLNDLNIAIAAAVDERMKSEHFKTELITNVSHDLKTPLTSIINYVDLLKKWDIDNPTIIEYISVLERKSQRLKKLTEDLVEASKASTGVLTVNHERLDVVQLLRQALGEFEEKFAARRLESVLTVPADGAWVEADGRHLWRVLDNLLSNCHKYALEGTRIYLDAAKREGNVVLTVKNISRQPLNIPAEQLMERFVRGDESRTTDGSGLGLSIVRSLTELQGGVFRLDIDGDLFKASVCFPECAPPAENL